MSALGAAPVCLVVGEIAVNVGEVVLTPPISVPGTGEVHVRPELRFSRSFADFVAAHVEPGEGSG